MLPLSAIFIGLTISWSANTQALILSKEVVALSELNPDGLENYVFPFQYAILIFLIATLSWAALATGYFDPPSGKAVPTWSQSLIADVTILVCTFFGCIAVRTSWQVVGLVATIQFVITQMRKQNLVETEELDVEKRQMLTYIASLQEQILEKDAANQKSKPRQVLPASKD
ncbi:hypothetical protein HHL28_07585 [Aerophototrophica crusticola]|uniref:Uncharacterized protein n=1 Tax=Aerophototrophica crusticola TaxID=1709002 RepID=A0A858R6E6_9PROT|nr:hypothetical protein HHL28_07585 [Rhodospirillaceae bacterium B3]